MSNIPENESEKINNVAESVAQQVAADSGEQFSLKKEVFEWLYTIVAALLIAFLIKTFVFDVVRVDGSSMYPTLTNNDRLIVTKLGYKPKQKDIIILDSTYHTRQAYYAALEKSGQSFNPITKAINYFSLPEDLKTRYYVKRIIATPGQTVDIIDGNVYVDGELLDEEYYDGVTTAFDPSVEFPQTVRDDCVFVMGDNRPASKDSRSSDLGQVPIKAISGKSQVRIWPFSAFGLTR